MINYDYVAIASHKHTDETETGLLVLTVLVWMGVSVLVGILIYQACSDRKAAENSGQVHGRY